MIKLLFWFLVIVVTANVITFAAVYYNLISLD